jgi:nitroreductase
MTINTLPAPGERATGDLKSVLQSRRSVPALQLKEPGPDRTAIEEMLTIASRIPDHGKLAPWRFIVIGRQAAEDAGRRFLEIAEQQRGPLDETAATIEGERMLRAPAVIVVVSRAAQHPKIPVWEQQLSAGAVCYNLLLAAKALGFGANWLTEWMAYDADAKAVLGVAQDEAIAGFIHIGTPAMAPADRPRPLLADIVTWRD